MSEVGVIVLADLHINSVFGITHPRARNDGGSFVERNLIQKWLTEKYIDFIDEAKTKTKDTERTWILNGDIVDIDWKNRSWEFITRNPAYILEHCLELLDGLIPKEDDLFILRGTPAHVGNSAFTEEHLGRDLGAIQDDNGNYSWSHLRAIFGGVSFDIAHHYSMGYLPWTYANAAMKLAVETISEYNSWGETPPDLVIRSHNHRFADSGRTFETRGICTPAFQFVTEYLHRRGKANARPHIGGIYFICNNDTYTMQERIYKPKRSYPWVKQPTKTL